jgi:hypothetical protein
LVLSFRPKLIHGIDPQLEDCLFDGGGEAEVGVVYMNAKICGPLASNFPSPRVIARFCVFDRCSAFGAVTALHSCATVHNCLFVGGGRSCLNASDSAKMSVSNSEFALSASSEVGVAATGSDLGSILQNFVSAENFSDKLTCSNTLKTTEINLSEDHVHYSWIFRCFKRLLRA